MTSPAAAEPLYCLEMYFTLSCLLFVLFLCETTVALSKTVSPSYEYDCVTPVTDNDDSSQVSNNIDDAISNLVNNETTLSLIKGCHILKAFRVINGLHDITIVGEEDGNVILTCNEGIGLAFLGISGLAIENITIQNCGMVGSGNLQTPIQEINSTIFLFHQVASNSQVGVFMGDIENLMLRNVVIANTSGIGLLAINIIGDSVLDNIDFNYNRPLQCFVALYEIDLAPTIGGGFFLLYADYIDRTVNNVSITIIESTFFANQDCSITPIIPLYYDISRSAAELGYSMAGGGGFGLVLTQVTFTVNILVTSCVFEANGGIYGAGVFIQHFQGSSGAQIVFDECEFNNNGFTTDAPTFYQSNGAGGMIIMNISPPSNRFINNITISNLQANIIRFDYCNFTKNHGNSASGLFVYSLYSGLTTLSNENKITFSDCYFGENIALASGAVISAVELKANARQPGIQLYLCNVEMENNDGSTSQQNSIYGVYDSVISLISINVTICGNSTFQNNKGSSVLAVTSNINIQGEVVFKENSASAGGAIQLLTQSYLIIKNNSRIDFVDNSAAGTGGAIFVILSGVGTQISSYDCFLWFEEIDNLCNFTSCFNPTEMNVKITFENNSAPLGGTIYGSALTDCPWLYDLKRKYGFDDDASGFEVLNTLPNEQFVFNPSLNSSQRVVNTEAFSLNLSNTSSSEKPIQAYPGEQIKLTMAALDQLNQSVPLAITSIVRNTSLFDQVMNIESQLGLSGYWFLPGNESASEVQAYVHGDPNGNQSVQVSLYSVVSPASSDIIVKLEGCPYGFEFDEDQQGCVCVTIRREIECEQTTGVLTVPARFWLGKTPVDDYSFHTCIQDYCKSGPKSFRNNNANSQCEYNRIGILCGGCEEGTSIVFGSNRCVRCGHNEWLIIVFLLMGILLIASIGFLNFTISEGYLNGVIFYSNILSFFIPIYTPFLNGASIFIFISLLNFDPGVETCVYPEMTTLARTGLSFLFPFYLFLLMFALIVIARCSSRVANAGFSPTKMFATLLLLCYSSVSRTCIEILGFIEFTGPTGNKYVGWQLDPNQTYGREWHGFLVFLSVMLLLFYIIPFSVILFCPPKVLYKTRCGQKIAVKFKPLFDAFWNPFKPKFVFWPGLRCLLRIIPFAISATTDYPDNAFYISVFAALYLLTHELVQPFEKTLQNRVETFLLINLLLLAIGSLYYLQKTEEFFGSLSSFYIIVLMLLAYAAFLFIGIIHINIRFPKIWPFVKAKLYRCCCYCCNRNNITEEEAKDYRETDIGELIYSQFDEKKTSFREVTFTELREPSLED